MSEFGGLCRKQEKTQHALVGLGSAALAAAVAFTQVRRPEFPERDDEVYTKNKNKNNIQKNSAWLVQCARHIQTARNDWKRTKVS